MSDNWKFFELSGAPWYSEEIWLFSQTDSLFEEGRGKREAEEGIPRNNECVFIREVDIFG